MSEKNEIVAEQLAKIRRTSATSGTRFATIRRSKPQETGVVASAGALKAAAAMVARQAATKIWTRLTGELPPPVQEAEKEAAKLRKEMSA